MTSAASPHLSPDRPADDDSEADRRVVERAVAHRRRQQPAAVMAAVGAVAFSVGIVLGFSGTPAGYVAVAAAATLRAAHVAAATAPGPARIAQVQTGPSANRVYIPALQHNADGPSCISAASVINLGPDASKAILVLWRSPDAGGTDCQAPDRLICSGLLRPGGAWDFSLEPAKGQAASAVIYSFTAKRLSEIGVSADPDRTVADYACERLAATIIGDCEAYAAFASAFASGGSHLGLPMNQAAGSPMAAEVYRRCSGDLTGGVDVTSLYEGTGAHALGSHDASFGGYRYQIAPLHADDRGLTSILHIQNAGAATATVDIGYHAEGACTPWPVCRTLTIDPGGSAIVIPTDCVEPNWNGAAWLRSSEPLAVVADTIGRDNLASFSAVAPGVATGPTGAPSFTTTSHAAFGPLVYGAERGWDCEVTVQNLSLSVQAQVDVAFLNPDGTVSTTMKGSICPRGIATFLRPVTDDRRGNRATSVRVVSRATGGQPASEVAPITAVVTLLKYSDTARTETTEAMSYNLLPDATTFAWPAGGGAGGSASGSPIVALPLLRQDLDASSTTSELAVTNLVLAEGWTDFAVLLYDQNDLVDVICRRLSAGQTHYFDLQWMGAIPNGFRGSAVVSATYWEHPVPADAAGPARQLVGLGAVAVRRTGTRLGEDVPGDELAGAVGVPLAAWPDAVGLPPDPCGTQAIAGDVPASGGHWQSVVPVHSDRAGFITRLTIRNEGEGTTDVRLYFKALGDCLRNRICTVDALAPGTGAQFSASECVGPDWIGSVVLHSREPLTVSGTAAGPGPPFPPISVVGRPGRLPFDVNDDWKVDSADRAVVAAALGSGPGDPSWNPRADLDASGRVDDTDLKWWMELSLCGSDRASGTPAVDPAPLPSQALLPTLQFEGQDDICLATVTAQNLSAEPTKPLLLLWGAPAESGPCAGPTAVACGGLLRPGSTWTFGPPEIPNGSQSGLVLSFNVKPLSQIGASVGGDEPTADYLCRTLATTLVGDCGAYSRFKAAFDAGANFDGVPLAMAAGSAVIADVRRLCPADVSPGVDVAAAYTGIGANQLGLADSATGSYVTYAPLIYADKAGFNTVFYLQNAGAAVASVALWFQAQDDCSGATKCRTLQIGPGESAPVVVARRTDGCVGPDWQGNAWFESDQPLAVAADIFGRDTLTTNRGVTADIGFDAGGAVLPAGGGTTAFGPLYFGQETGWDAGVQVQNLSRNRPAQVRVEYLDAAGAPVLVMDDLICAAGTQTFFLPVTDMLRDRQVGSIRVVSQRILGDPEGEPPAAPAPIAAVALQLTYSDPARTETRAGFTYNLLSEREALIRPAGGGAAGGAGAAGGTAAGIGAVALSGVARAGGNVSLTSEIAIANFVHAPGWTQVAVLLYDANGIIDIVCRRIAAGSVAYVDLAELPLAAGFRGGAIVSATEWRHPVGGVDRGPIRNLVGLGAVVVTRRVNPTGDELAVTEGQPLAQVPAVLGGDAVVRCAANPTDEAPRTPTASTGTPSSGTPTATRTPATPGTPRTPSPTSTPRGKLRVFLPYLVRSVPRQ